MKYKNKQLLKKSVKTRNLQFILFYGNKDLQIFTVINTFLRKKIIKTNKKQSEIKIHIYV